MLLKYAESGFLPWVQNECFACVSVWRWCYILVVSCKVRSTELARAPLPRSREQQHMWLFLRFTGFSLCFTKYFKFRNLFLLPRPKFCQVNARTFSLFGRGDVERVRRGTAVVWLGPPHLSFSENAVCVEEMGGHCASDGRLPIAARHWRESRCLNWMDFLCWSVSQFLSLLSGSAPELGDTLHLCFSCCRFLFLLPNYHKTGVASPPTHTHTPF